ncbi:MAG: integrase [Bacteroidetes bacterium QH_2_63_10]|nr:MAG: integrase [Bacteroidetes bacterium QH_2_63_10]
MDLIDSFLEGISSQQTRRAYRTDLRRFFSEGEVDTSLVQAIEPEGIQAFLRAMHRNDQSQSTQRRRLSALRRFFDWLIKQGDRTQNPARHPEVQLLRPDSRSSSRTLTKDETEALIEAALEPTRTGLRDRALILTIVFGALRRHEVASLDVDDIRPLGRYWVLDLQASQQHSGYVRIPETVVEAIEQMKDRYGIDRGRLWRSLSNRNRGTPMSPDAIYKVVRRVAGRAGLDAVSIDVLRRTGLQLALRGGADVPQVQAHGRLSDSSSAARLHDGEERSGRLGGSAVEYIDLDVLDVLSDP